MEAGYIFLLLFGVTLFVMYIAIRRAWTTTLNVGAVGAILSALFVILFALTNEDTSTAQAIFSGLVVGLGFPVIVVIVATFFRTNQPGANVRIVSQSQPQSSPPPQVPPPSAPGDTLDDQPDDTPSTT